MRLLPLAGAILVFGGIPAIVWYQHYNDVRENKILDQLEQQQYANQPPPTAANTFAEQRDFIQRTQGDDAARLFEICKQSPPTLEKDKQTCQIIIDRMNREMANPQSR